MATPVAHALSGVMCLGLLELLWPKAQVKLVPKTALLAAIAGCLPDFDIAVSFALTGGPAKLHGGPTHSWFFAALIGLLSFAILRGEKRRGLSVLIFLCVSSHVVIDWATGPHPGLHPTYGLALWWPFDGGRYQLPITVFRGVRHGDLSVWLTWHNLATALLELVVVVPLTLLVWTATRRARLRGRPTLP